MNYRFNSQFNLNEEKIIRKLEQIRIKQDKLIKENNVKATLYDYIKPVINKTNKS